MRSLGTTASSFRPNIRGILGVVLRIAPAAHVEQNAGPPILGLSRLGKLKSELGLADPRRTDQDGQRPRQQAAAEPPIQRLDARRKPQFCIRHHRNTCPGAANPDWS